MHTHTCAPVQAEEEFQTAVALGHTAVLMKENKVRLQLLLSTPVSLIKPAIYCLELYNQTNINQNSLPCLLLYTLLVILHLLDRDWEPGRHDGMRD